ncbi:MAG: cation-translocating P-type ATPase [Planctomycetota bacterium]
MPDQDNPREAPGGVAGSGGRAWHTLAPESVAGLLGTDLAEGLRRREARRRLHVYGPNRLREARPVPWWRVLASQFKSLVVLLLVAAAVISFLLEENLEGISILVVILLNAGVGFATEYRANRAMEALQKLGAQEAVALRSGVRQTIPAADVVPGDLVVLQEGDAVPADGRVVESAELQLAEAPLTGESMPVSKGVEALADADTALGDRTNMVFKGTNVVSGNGTALVVGTGMNTEIGHVSELVSAAEDVETPLEKRLAKMGRRLIFFCLGVAGVVAVAGIAQGTEVGLMLEAAIALAVAAVPEGLPAVATITLAVGMRRMAEKNALIRRLPAVETLGSATCVCTDKTGTLTRSEMAALRIWVWDRDIRVSGTGYAPEGRFSEDARGLDPLSDHQVKSLLTVGLLCSNARLTRGPAGEWETTGDPTEVALVVAAAKAGLWAEDLEEQHPELREFAFSSSTMMMGTVDDHLNARLEPAPGKVLCVKGSPEAVAEHCSTILHDSGPRQLTAGAREQIRRTNESLAAEGLRVIGLALKAVEEVPETAEQAYEGLTWLGLVGIMDPPREEVRETVDLLTCAGIKTVMITGDQPATAATIAAELHIAPADAPVLTGREIVELDAAQLAGQLDDVEVFARVSPEQKVDILQALQDRGEICAMLGDGVNDAIALKRADIGVAMGIKGTEVAKETADMLLLDDQFVTVGAAVHQGRIIYSNIRKFIHYLFSCNLSEICTMLFASMLGEPLPLLPLQILWLNMVTDVFPALALAMEPGEADAMDRPPRSPEASLLDRPTVSSIGAYALLITAATLAAFVFGRFVRGYEAVDGADPAITMAFMTIALAQLFHVFNSRKEARPLRGREWLSNPYVVGAVVLTVGLQLAAVYMPGLTRVLKTSAPAPADWLVIGVCSLVPLTAGQLTRWVRAARRKPGGELAAR